MQYMNSSPVMTMILQPDFTPPPPGKISYMVSRPRTPPSYKIRVKDKPPKYPRPVRSSTTDTSSLSSKEYTTRRAYNQSTQTHFITEPTPAKQSPRVIRRPVSCDSSRYSMSGRAPYAARLRDTSGNYGMSSYPAVPNNAYIPDYDSLRDPHMMDYYAKKYGLRPQPPNRPSSAPGYGKSYRFGSLKRNETYNQKKKRTARGYAEYKVTVKTSDKANCGTDARVFIRIFGRRGKTEKKRLCKKSGQSNHSMFRFSKGSSHTFKIRDIDVGDIKSIVIEHDGIEERHSWFLNEIVISKKGRSYTFVCGRWFSLYKEDCQLSRELNPVSGGKAKIINYQITTVTGDKRGAGTDAHVFITIYGSKGITPRLELKDEGKKKFERGKSDEFSLRSVNVGKMRKIRVEIDNIGFAPAWYLERVVIVTSEQRMFFPCGEWLCDDEQLYRDLIGTEDPSGAAKSNFYTVSVFTGDVRGAGTDADVFITIFGDLGDSGKKKLDDKHNNFERGQKDVFKIKCTNVGKIKKIRIGHNNSGSSPGWFLDKVIIDDSAMGKVYTFPCGRWFAKDEDDGKITRELLAGKGDEGIPYTVTIFTGDVRGAATNANVYIILFGGRHGEENTGKIDLRGKFERNRQVVCEVESVSMLSPLEKIEIGHDNTGIGPGWFLDKVVVICHSTGLKQVFPCNKWLATDEGDGLISRQLYDVKSQRQQVTQKTAWNCAVKTSDVNLAGTDSNVFLQIYGDKGKSDEIKIDNETDNFEVGQTDNFKINFVDVGKIFKLRVWHDASGLCPGWHLDSITLTPVGGTRSNSYGFRCGRWLAKDEEDEEIIREIPATGPLVRNPLPLVRYIIAVTTGDKIGAGTDASVFCCLFGEKGDTGNRPLRKSKNNVNKFERKSVDEFVIEAVTLQRLTKIKIGHDNSGPGSGWFLEKVEAWEEGKGGDKIVFPCGRWLALDEDDGSIVRDLLPEGSPQLLSTTRYNIAVKTGDVRFGGTDANVSIKIFGSEGDTGELRLVQGENTSNKFERGRRDLFNIEAADIGTIDRITIGHDDSKAGAGWFLDGVEIDVPSHGKHYSFTCHRWLATDEEDGKTRIELYPTNIQEKDRLLPYEITVKTGDKLKAGTDANVTLQIYGEDGKSEELKLRDRSDNFERNAVDRFKVEAKDVGPISKIRIGHDGKGFGAGWFLESVKIQRFVQKMSKRKKRRKSSMTPEQQNIETYWFVCRQWFDKGEGDGLIIRELVPTDESGRPIDHALQEKEYSIHVFTGDKFGAGTDADVYMTLYGENGDSGERKLSKSETNINKFERKQEDIFKIKAADLGPMKKMKIRRSDALAGADWYLDRVAVRFDNEHVIFPCEQWLSTTEGDGQIERTLVPVSLEKYEELKLQSGKKKGKVKDVIGLETKAQLTTYKVAVKTGNVSGAGTDANVYIILYGKNDDSGKVNLKSSTTHTNKFEKNNVDLFTVESVDLGDLTKIKIGHDNSGLFGSAWYLEYVEIDAPSEGLKWRFPCGRWLDKSKDDGLLERELFPSTDQTITYAAKVPYEICVTTSDISSAGTEADVYVVIFGRDGISTEQASLCPNKNDRKSKFKRGATAKFVLELDDVGETIEKIRIGHDGKGFGAGWHLDKVEVRRLLDNKKNSETYFFSCGRWLAKGEDDGQIVRELAPERKLEEKMHRGQLKRRESTISNSLKNQKYRVHVYTGDVFSAGTDANVYITLFGENGDSGERKLNKSENYTDKFERGHKDTFTFEAVDLGKLYKVHIRHDNALLNPSWFLDRVEVEDCETDEKFVFHCEQWLAKNKGDKKIGRSLYVVGYDGETSTKRSVMTSRSFGSSSSKKFMSDAIPEGPTIPYKIKVMTGSQEGASCTADGFIKIFGPQKKRGQKATHRIELISERGKFKRGTAESFDVEALDVGEIKEIEVGHNGVDDRWFIEEIVIDQPTLGKNHIFQCMKWFAKDREDGLTSRRLGVHDATTSTYKAKIPYLITVYTGNESSAGTDGGIMMSVFGTKGNAPDIRIEKSEENGVLLERGSMDQIWTELEDIGKPVMIKLSHNGKGQRPDWFCEKIQLRNNKSGKETIFPCNAWFSSKKGDKQLTRELSASSGGHSVLKGTTLHVTVKTGDKPGSGTDANVFMELTGEFGQSGKLRLDNSESHKNMFESGNEDIFTFENKWNIGKIRKCRIWHDSKGFRPGWFLDWIEIHDEVSDRITRFKCGRWLSKGEDDGQTMRELVAVGSSRPNSASGLRNSRTPSSLYDFKPSKYDDGNRSFSERGSSSRRSLSPVDAKPTKYEVIVVTSSEKDAGTDANVCVTIYGENGDSGKQPLKQRFRDVLFQKGRTDKFTLEMINLGELQKLRLEHGDSGFGSDWLCDHIIVKDTSSGQSWKFHCCEWIGGKKAKGQLYRDLFPRPV